MTQTYPFPVVGVCADCGGPILRYPGGDICRAQYESKDWGQEDDDG